MKLAEQSRGAGPVNDPAEISGTTEERLAVFCEVRDELKEKITSWLYDISMGTSFE